MPTETDEGTVADLDDVAVLAPDDVADGTDPLGVGAGTAPPGAYALLFTVDPAATITVGALGDAAFPAGAYAYVGSAFGSNGLGRVGRHRRVADGAHDVRHWHVDYLGSHPNASLTAVVAAPRADVECRVATELRRRLAAATDDAVTPLTGFGASDCECPAHLVGGADPNTVRAVVVESMRAVTSAEADD